MYSALNPRESCKRNTQPSCKLLIYIITDNNKNLQTKNIKAMNRKNL